MKRLYVHMYELDCYKKFVELYCVIYFLMNYLYIIQSNEIENQLSIITHNTYLLYLKIKNLGKVKIYQDDINNTIYDSTKNYVFVQMNQRFSSIKISI